MSRRSGFVWAAAFAALLVAGCSREEPTAVRKTDAKSWEGGDAAYAAGNWKAGDKDSWEQQMKARIQAQNEYVRVGGSN